MPRAFFVVFSVLLFCLEGCAVAKKTVISPVPLGQCCGFNARFEIQRYPRYPHYHVRAFPRMLVKWDRSRTFVLPGLPEGGYRITFEPLALQAGRVYRFAVSLTSMGKVGVTAEVFAGTEKLDSKYAKITKRGRIELVFKADDQPVPGGRGMIDVLSRWVNGQDAVHVLKLWVHGRQDVLINRITLLDGEGRLVASGHRALLLPDIASGVYHRGQQGQMRLLPAPDQMPVDYRVEDVSGGIVKASPLDSGKTPSQVWRIPLPTGQSGYFRVRVRLRDSDGKERYVKRAYVVIEPVRLSPEQRRFFGICTEEEGLTDFVPAAVTAEDLYRLMRDIGVGSVRMFNPAMPNELSEDGVHYDFHALDAAIATAHKYGMEILLELGSNRLSRLPKWLLTSRPGEETIDLRKGMRFDHQRKAFEAKGYDKTPYLDLEKYRSYLERLFAHLGGRVKNFEIWNEPGHKFLPEDFIRIVKITREVQKRYAPDSHLVGFSSTAYPMFGHGRRRGEFPGFLEDMLRLGGGEYVDVISYHSRHAFNFLGKEDWSDPLTDYAVRIRILLNRMGYENLPLWDTERGVPWSSDDGRLDRFGADGGPVAWLKPFDLFEPARQMPKIYMQARSQGVKRVFWFNWFPGTQNITRSRVRESLFDAGLEPTPAIYEYVKVHAFAK